MITLYLLIASLNYGFLNVQICDKKNCLWKPQVRGTHIRKRNLQDIETHRQELNL